MENQMKFFMSAFIVVLLGVILIRSIGNDVGLVKISSRTITNESVSLTVVTADITNETVTMDLLNITATLANNFLTELTALRNATNHVSLIGFCNITLTNGSLFCNETSSTTIYADYTINDHSTGELTYDELNSFDACRNSSTVLTAGTHCNVTLATGVVRVVYDNVTDNIAYIDYKYEPDDYVHSSAARTFLTLTILLFAIFILAIGIGYVVKSLKESDLM